MMEGSKNKSKIESLIALEDVTLSHRMEKDNLKTFTRKAGSKKQLKVLKKNNAFFVLTAVILQ